MGMKKYFLAGAVAVIILAVTLISYGIFVNQEGESMIADRLANRSVLVSASKVDYHDLTPELVIPQTTMEAEHSTDVIARVDGEIAFSNMTKNKHVEAGSVIVSLINNDIPLKESQAHSALAKAQALELQAKNSFNRYQRLIDMDATSLEKLDEAKATYYAQVAAVADAEAQLEQVENMRDRLEVRSPISGTVIVIYKEAGSFVTAGTPICMVGDFSALWFAADLEDSVIRSLLAGGNEQQTLDMHIESPLLTKSYSTEYGSGNRGAQSVYPVSLQGIYPSLDQPASVRRVVFNVSNLGGVLEPQSYQNLYITSRFTRRVLSIPKGALKSSHEGTYVFVITADNTLEKRTVIAGSKGVHFVEILNGLSQGDLVVTSGLEGLKEGSRVQVNLEE